MRIKIIQNLLFYFILILICFRFALSILPFGEYAAFKKKPYSLRLADRQGKLIHVFPIQDGQRREYIPYTDLPGHVIDIFIFSEDKRFFYHNGVDTIAVIRALYLNLTRKSIVSGASTITMQLSRFISPHKREFTGKIREGLNAIRLEGKCGKEELFELWINAIPFGMNTIGISSASKAYFQKEVRDLTELETCILAVILRNPSFYQPVHDPEKVIKKASQLALLVFRNKSIHHDETDHLLAIGIEEELREIIHHMTLFQWPSLAPHFSLYVKNHLTPEQVRSGKIITTTLDAGLNQIIESKIRDKLEKYHMNRLTNGAALVLNNKSGEILAYVGSNDFNDKEHAGEIDGLHIRNQPGSCLKPFLYAYGLDNGYLPHSLLPDIPSDFGTEEIYTPLNFNNRFHGPVRLRVALASSLNIPAVYLITQLGVENFRKKLIELGFESLHENPHSSGSGLALGNAGVTLFELTRAFAIFPAKGRKITPRWQKEDSRNPIPGEHPEGDRVFSTYAASMICQILSDNASRALGFTTDSVLNTEFPGMFKTGTSDQYGNIWALGATVDFTVGIWLGNFSGETVIGMPGSSIPAHIVVDIISLLRKHPPAFPLPENTKTVSLCSLSGQIATDLCPGTIHEYLPLHASVEPCQFHVFENGKTSIHYPPLYASWAHEQSGYNQPLLTRENRKFPYIRTPGDKESFYLDPVIPLSQQELAFEIIHHNEDDILTITVNGRKQGDIRYPYIWFFPLQKGEWEIEVSDGNFSDRVTVFVR